MRQGTSDKRRPYRAIAVIVITAAQFGMIVLVKAQSSKSKSTSPPAMNMKVHPMAPASSGLPFEGELPSLDGATAWINSLPLKPADLRGRVVLIEFWTYTCINWRRQFPYVRAWAKKYGGKGLIVIGVHSPEFAFEKNLDNVRR